MAYKLTFGRARTIDPRGPVNPVVLEVSIKRLGRYHRIPTARVRREWVGFTATITAVTLKSSSKVADRYEIFVSWEPGGDTSGAEVVVGNPYNRQKATAIIQMAY